jgi:hypothetical protein
MGNGNSSFSYASGKVVESKIMQILIFFDARHHIVNSGSL